MNPYVTKSGRARPTGRVTRLSATVGRPKKVKPLPLHMQVRPQALAPLRKHPGCWTSYPVSGAYITFRDTVSPGEFGLGYGLDGQGRWTLYVKGFGEYRHSDPVQALGWARAARECGYDVTLMEA